MGGRQGGASVRRRAGTSQVKSRLPFPEHGERALRIRHVRLENPTPRCGGRRLRLTLEPTCIGRYRALGLASELRTCRREVECHGV
jgi:hypothetical protein